MSRLKTTQSVKGLPLLNLTPPYPRSTPAPLQLCSVPGFDLIQDENFCSVERSALEYFYQLAHGDEWSHAEGWTDPYLPHCDWYNVSCDESNTTVHRLELRTNGLSGELSPYISNLTNLVHLDLSDNDIKVSIALGHLF